MAINFPNSPAPNELFTTAYGTYKWDTHKWVIQEGFTGSFISGGVVYSGTNSLLCSPIGTTGQVLSSNGTSPPTWIDTASFAETTATIKTKLGITTLSGSNTGDVTVANDTSTNSDYYPLFSTTTTGGLASAKVSSTNLTFNPLSGQLNAVTFNSTSDINAKKDISEIKNPLDTVNKIQGVKFSWKHNGKPSYGFIAQDIEKVLPEVVATDTFGMKSVNYDATIAILLEAIKELHKKVEQLQKQ